jgi:hypothetical protein
MPGCARREIVREGEIGVYHVWSRCVQRAFLCGRDPYTGEDYSYRREWIQRLFEYQAGVFAVDVGNYSILDNHEHLILRTRPDIAALWSDEEAAWRWRLAWPSWRDGVWSREPTDEQIQELLDKPAVVASLRGHLSSLSWFMARCKEPIAKLANAETDCRGHFWAARFGCRELVDEAALLTCSAYVDLNQVKAGAAESLETSNYSAIQDRLRAWRSREANASVEKFRHREGEEFRLERADVEQLLADCWLAPIEERRVDISARTLSEPITIATTNTTANEPSRASEERQLERQSAETAVEKTPARANAESEKDAEQDQTPFAKAPHQKTIHRRLLPRKRRRASNDPILAMPWEQYRAMVQWAAAQVGGQQVRPPPTELAVQLRSRGIQPDQWYCAVDQFEGWCRRAAGAADRLAEIVSRAGRRWLHGVRRCRDVFT